MASDSKPFLLAEGAPSSLGAHPASLTHHALYLTFSPMPGRAASITSHHRRDLLASKLLPAPARLSRLKPSRSMAAGSDRDSRNAPDAAAAATGRLTPITNMVMNNLLIFESPRSLGRSRAARRHVGSGRENSPTFPPSVVVNRSDTSKEAEFDNGQYQLVCHSSSISGQSWRKNFYQWNKVLAAPDRAAPQCTSRCSKQDCVSAGKHFCLCRLSAAINR
jgi:hypothetical protein